MKPLKWILWGVGALIVVVGAVVAYVAATFDPNDYTPRLVDLVKQRTGRTLAIDGKVRLAFFPKLGADIGQVTLSEPNGSGLFARVEGARVAVAVWPLLRKRVIVDRVTLKGVTADLVRYKDGRTNVDDLTGTSAAPATRDQPSAGPTFVIDVGGVTIENASIGWRDERDGTNVRLSNLNLATDRLASGIPGRLKLASRIEGVQPRASLQLDVDTGYTLDFATQAVALSSLVVKAVGDAPGARGLDARFKGGTVDVDPRASRITLSRVELAAKSKDGLDAKIAIPRLQVTPDQATSEAITGDVTLATAQRTIATKLEISPLTATGKQLHASRLHVDLTAKQGDLAVQGAVATPMTLDLERRQAQVPGLAGELTVSGPTIPNRSMKAALTGGARADWGAQNANAALAVKMDESKIDTNVTVAHWSQPAITFDIVADRLNVDRYLPPSKSDAPPAGGAAPAGGAGRPGGAQAEQPFDLSALKALNATGSVKIDALQVANVKAQQVALRLNAAGGRLDVNPISANLYQGTVGGSVAVNANDNRFAVKQKLSRISVGPLLRDAANKDLLEGRGDVVVDVTTAGTTVTALKKGLAGTTRLALRDGAIKGVDIAGTIRTAKAMLGSRSALEQQTQGGVKTDFSELTASFVIKKGVAHNEDLQAKSPLLRLAGRGDVDIGESSIDYTATASVVATATGQGGKRVSDVAGVTVPVRATGPLTNIKYGVDVGSLATDVAKETLQRELGRQLGGKSGRQPADGAGAISDTLRGFLGN